MEKKALTTFLSETFSKLQLQIVHFFPKIFIFITLFLIGWFIAWVCKLIIIRSSTFVTHLIPIKLKSRVLSPLQTRGKASQIFGLLAYWSIILISLGLATEAANIPIISEWGSKFMHFIPNIIFTALVIVLGYILAIMSKDTIITFSFSIGLTQPEQLARIIQFVIVLIAIVIGFEQLGISTYSLTLLMGVLSGVLLLGIVLTFSLGAKSFITNILASYYLQKIFKVGHFIEINQVKGRITKITGVSVILDSDDGQLIIPAKTFNETTSSILKED